MPKTYNTKRQNWRTKRQFLEPNDFSYDHGVTDRVGDLPMSSKSWWYVVLTVCREHLSSELQQQI